MNNKRKIKVEKAVFPVAGLGTRFLPATKASPKEMLTVVDKPIIQYAVEEAISAGINELIFVTSIHKRAIEDHFDKNFELEYQLLQKNKLKLLKTVQEILPSHVNCAYIRQKEALGLGHAILCAKPLIGNSTFAILLADDLIYTYNEKNVLQQMINQYNATLSGIIAVEKILKKNTAFYGIVKTCQNNIIKSIIEKPLPKKATSTKAVVGRYILPATIFKYLENLPKGKGNEIQLTDAIAKLIKSERILAHQFIGDRYDCGDKLGFLIANFKLTCQDPILGKNFITKVKEIINQNYYT